MFTFSLKNLARNGLNLNAECNAMLVILDHVQCYVADIQNQKLAWYLLITYRKHPNFS